MYGLNVVEVPSRLPNIRIDHDPRLFYFQSDRLVSLFLIVLEAHVNARPVLIGTASVDESQRIYDLLAHPEEHIAALNKEPFNCLLPLPPEYEAEFSEDCPVGIYPDALRNCTLNKQFTSFM